MEGSLRVFYLTAVQLYCYLLCWHRCYACRHILYFTSPRLTDTTVSTRNKIQHCTGMYKLQQNQWIFSIFEEIKHCIYFVCQMFINRLSIARFRSDFFQNYYIERLPIDWFHYQDFGSSLNISQIKRQL